MPRHALVFAACHERSGRPCPQCPPPDEIKPKTPETAILRKAAPGYSGHLHGIRRPTPHAPPLKRPSRDVATAKTDIQQQKFGGTAIGYIAALNFSVPAGPKQTGEMLSSNFSSPASANRGYFIARNLTFAQDQQPAKADMIKEIMGKYGTPTIVGDQHLYYIYRKGSIVSAGAQIQGSGRDRSHRQAARSEDRRQTQRRDRPRQLRCRGQARAGQGKRR